MNDFASQRFNRHQWLKDVLKINDLHALKLPAAALWGFADANGYCYPNQDQIANSIGMKSTSRLSEHLHRLQDLGLLRISYAQGYGYWRSANYQLISPTVVGTNSTLITNSFLGTSKALKNNMNRTKLTPTEVGVVVETEDDYVVDGKDTRPPPSWAVE